MQQTLSDCMTPQTSYRDTIFSQLSSDLPATMVDAVESISQDSVRMATLSGRMVDFNTYNQL